MNWISNVQWPEGTLGFDNDVSTDKHRNESEARSVCDILEEEGFGGERKIFPIKTWIYDKDKSDE